ncbi:MAG: GH25 family lysozyme [Eubacteriales bacterium]
MSKKIIDVSEHRGTIDWNSVKGQIDGAIIRIGYGSNISGASGQWNQDDTQFDRNVRECERLGIPYGCYLYSYANSADKVQSEIDHALRKLKGHKPTLPVYLDLEERNCKNWWQTAASAWCQQIRKAGYIDGIYSWAWAINGINDCASSYWACAYGPNDGTKHDNYKPKLSGNRQLAGWQYTSKGKINGIAGNVDTSEFYVDYSTKKSAATQTQQKSNSKATTKPTTPKQSTSKPVPRLDLEVQCLNRGRSGKKVGGGEICMYDDAIVGLSIGVTCGSVEYRVHTVNGKWLSKITKCDWGAPDCYAGDLKHMIDAVQIYFNTDTKKTGGKYYKVEYQVKTQKRGWLGKIHDTNWESGDGSHTAGVFGDPIIGIRAKIVSA